MPGEVTSGRELNSYEGNANLAAGTGGDSTGYSKIDLSPLQTYALKKYDTNLRQYEQQQKDKKDLEDKFMDPSLNVFLDKGLADQINPKLERLKELAKENLQMNPNSDKWYEFHNLYNEILKDNGRAKAVQTIKQNTRDAAGKTADPHEKEKLDAYANQLDNYTLGDEIPSYNQYFKYNDAHVPKGDLSTSTAERIGADGKTKETVRSTIYNPMGLDKKTAEYAVTDPTATKTWQDIAHVTLQDNGLPELNNAMASTYDKGMRLNVGAMQQKYRSEFNAYLKKNPDANFQQFADATGKSKELNDIIQGHNYLKQPLQYVPISADNGKELSGFTYYTDPQTGQKERLSVDDQTLGAIYGATRNVPGAKEEVLKSELSKLPDEINKLKAETDKTKSDAAANRQKANDNSRLTTANIGHLNAQTKTLNPLPVSEIPLIGREAVHTVITEKDKDGKVTRKEDQFIIKAGNLPEALRKKAGFGSLPPKPKTVGDKDGWKAYNEAKKGVDNDQYQMRFFDEQGKDITQLVSNKIRANKGNVNDAVKAATQSGIVIKFIDKNNNVVGTTQSVDRQTLVEDLKNIGKGDPSIGTDLPSDNSED